MSNKNQWSARHHQNNEVTTIQNGYLIIDGTQVHTQNAYELRIMLSMYVHAISSHLIYLEETDTVKHELHELQSFCASLFSSRTSNPIDEMGVCERDEKGNAYYRRLETTESKLSKLRQEVRELKEQLQALKDKD